MNTRFSDTDFQPIEEFPLVWRWTDARWNVLPPPVLEAIRPLTTTKANELWNITSAQRADVIRLVETSAPLAILDVSQVENDDNAREWLRQRNIPPTAQVMLQWNTVMAVVTTWAIFCTYWDDFCYASSDDVLVLPLSEQEFAYYAHYETFYVGRFH